MAKANAKEVALLGKAEVTAGINSIPAAATDAIRLAERPALALDFSPLEDKSISQAFGDGVADIIGKAMKLDVTFYIRSGGGLGVRPDFSPIIECAGHNVTLAALTSVSIAPVTALGASRKTSTFYYYEDGLLYKFVGAMSTFTFSAPIDGWMMAKGSIMAPYLEPTVAALPAGLAYQVSDPIKVTPSDIATEGGVAIQIGSFDFDSSVAISEIRKIGLEEIQMDDRPKPTVSFSKRSLGTAADFQRLMAASLVEFKSIVGAAGNRITFTGPQGQMESMAPEVENNHINRKIGIALRGRDSAYSFLID